MHSLINAFPHPYSQHSSIRITQSTVRFLYAFSPLTQGTVRFTFNPLSIRFTFCCSCCSLVHAVLHVLAFMKNFIPNSPASRPPFSRPHYTIPV